MKLPNIPGEFAFKALVRADTCAYWKPSEGLYMSLEEAQKDFKGRVIRWPVEIWEDGSIYCPSEEELK